LRKNVGPIAKGAVQFADGLAGGTNRLKEASAMSDKVAAPFELVGSKLAYMAPGAARGPQTGGIAYAKKISQVAKKRNEVFFFQNVNPKAAQHLKNGAATKPLHVKAKTDADGLIPMDQSMSHKGAAKGGDWVDKQNKSLKGMVDNGEYTTMKGPNGNDVLAKRLDDGRVVPVTADYDPLAIGTERTFVKPFDDPNLGTLTPRNQASIEAINNHVNHPGGAIAHHGPENLFSGEGPKFPLTAFTPDGKISTIHTEQQLKNFVNQQTSRGYGWGLQPHDSWGWTRGPNGQWQ
jgi:hypothetical protein